MAHCEQCQIEVPAELAVCPQCGAEPSSESDPLLDTLVLSRYRIVRLLAEGGMGRVYLAEQAVGTVVRRVAIKVLRRQLGGDKQLVSRFSREAETLVRLTHPNTVQLFDFGALPDGTLGLVMEYVEGHSLARELLRGALTPARTERLLTQACGALQEAHAHGIVHRDLKPDNMLVAERVGHGDFIKVLDFGIAKVSTAPEARASTKLTQQGMIIGTPQYMSPEQFSGDTVDARSDIYSLGVVAYEMLTAKLPFEAKTPWEWASRHLTAEPAALPLDDRTGLLPRHARAIRAALAKRPEDRPQSVAEFLALLTSANAEVAVVSSIAAPANKPASVSPEPVSKPGTLVTTRQEAPPRVWVRPALVAAAIALVGVLIWGAIRKTNRVRVPPAAPLATLAPVSSAAPHELPGGAALPELPSAVVSARGDHADDSAARERRHLRRAAVAAAQSAPAQPPASPPEIAVAPVARGADVSSRSASSTRALETAPSPSAKKPGSVPEDLAARLSQIQAAAVLRVETGVGLFQAAAGRYPDHPALQPARAQLAVAGERRIKELLSDGHCAQGQALFRALRAIAASRQAGAAFGKDCSLPR